MAHEHQTVDKKTDMDNVEDISNLWIEYFSVESEQESNDIPEQLISKMLEASSYKLSWVVDPFMRKGSIGSASKKLGRRFIGFETNQDSLLIAMKRIDQR